MNIDPAKEYIRSLQASEKLGAEVAACKKIQGRTASSLPVEQMPSLFLRRLDLVGIHRLYTHQAEALQAVRDGHHVVISTPTASGKTLVYNAALFEACVQEPAARALYLFPLKALAQDQLKTFNQWSDAIGDPAPIAAIYDGDTSDYQRRKIRRDPPNVIMTNPEMLHLALLPHHAKWAAFFRHLRLVVVDEVHTYRGLLGSHMAQLLRRLRRICRFYDARPIFVLASATVGNPQGLAEQLTGLQVQSIENSGAARGIQYKVLMDPSDGPAQAAILLLKAAMVRKLRTIVYTQSRKMAELISLWSQQRSGRFANRISVYRAGLLPEERRRIEADLKSGRLLAVVSTSALELGIDVGDLDLCVLAGYPGSIMASLQRSGRVGRKGQSSAVIMLAGQDALDQYYVANPEAFFKATPEAAVVNPSNPEVLASHLECTAAELPISEDDPVWGDALVAKTISHLERNGRLLRSADGKYLQSRRKKPHLGVNLRSAGRRFRLYAGDAVVGEINAYRLYRETHPGAIYLHRGETYRVRNVDEAAGCVAMEPVQVDYYTRIRTDNDVEIVSIDDNKYIGTTKCYIGNVRVTDQVTGFVRIHTGTGRTMAEIDLDVPPSIFETQCMWFEIDAAVCSQTIARGHDLLGALHAAEHAIIGIMPLAVLADRNDIGGLATPLHHQTRHATIFIYDGIPGGAGLSHGAFRKSDRLLSQAKDVMDRCPCDQGCPACVHSPKCGSGNHPMDKSGAAHLIEEMLHQTRRRRKSAKALRNPHEQKTENISAPAPRHYGVFDLETQRSAQEVGGWHMAHHMKVSCGVVFDSRQDAYTVYLEDQVDALMAHLKQFDQVVGFNSKRFDYKVLTGYGDFDFSSLPSVDLLELVHRQLGFRLSLNHLAEETLGVQKSGSGLDALKWWQQGEMDKIIAYCRKDVQITRDLFLFVRDNGYLIYRQKEGDRFRIPINLEASLSLSWSSDR
ncbi:MAG: DEAD/DEAH box helicase [Desulfobacteraceae bacterium]